MTAGSRRVLVGVDGSEDGLRAVHYAMTEAELRGATLQIAHAIDDAAVPGAWGVIWDTSLLDDAARTIVDAAIAQCVAEGFPRDRIDVQVVRGSAGSVLTQLSADADLAVVGRRSLSGLERIFVGSTSAGMAASARCPLIMVSAASSPGETGGLKRIGVAIEGGQRSDVALRWAFEEARFRGAELRIIHVVPQLPAGIVPHRPRPEDSEDALLEAGRSVLTGILTPVLPDYTDVRHQEDIVAGSPVDVLVDRSADLDLIALGAHSAAIPAMSLPGAIRGVMGHASCPVAVVRTWQNERFGIQ